MAMRASCSLGGMGEELREIRQSRRGSSKASSAPESWASSVKIPQSRARPAARATRRFWLGSDGSGAGAGAGLVLEGRSSTAEGLLCQETSPQAMILLRRAVNLGKRERDLLRQP